MPASNCPLSSPRLRPSCQPCLPGCGFLGGASRSQHVASKPGEVLYCHSPSMKNQPSIDFSFMFVLHVRLASLTCLGMFPWSMSSILTLALHHHHHFHLALTVQIRLTVVPLRHSWTAEPQVLVICCIKWSKKPSNPSLYLSVCLSVYLPRWSIMILYLVFWEPSEPSPESQRICSLDSARGCHSDNPDT